MCQNVKFRKQLCYALYRRLRKAAETRTWFSISVRVTIRKSQKCRYIAISEPFLHRNGFCSLHSFRVYFGVIGLAEIKFKTCICLLNYLLICHIKKILDVFCVNLLLVWHIYIKNSICNYNNFKVFPKVLSIQGDLVILIKYGAAAQISFDPVKANPLVLLTRHKTSSKEHGALRGGIPLSADSGQTFPLHSLLTEK